jgi:predicted transcriptional regulator
MAANWAHGEDDVRLPILEVLSQGGSWTTYELTRVVRTRLGLQSADLKRAAKRDNEQKIDQIIANALNEKRELCADGLIERVEKGVFRLTPKGSEFLKKFNERVDWAVAWFEENYLDVE